MISLIIYLYVNHKLNFKDMLLLQMSAIIKMEIIDFLLSDEEKRQNSQAIKSESELYKTYSCDNSA